MKKILWIVSVLFIGGFATACSSASTTSPASSDTNTAVHSFTVNKHSSFDMDEWRINLSDDLGLSVTFLGKQTATDVKVTLTPGGELPAVIDSYNSKTAYRWDKAIQFTGSDETVQVQITWTESGKQHKGMAEFELKPAN